MTTPTRRTRSLKQATATRRPRRRDDRGLTTLEWLLIVAAVAGLAALAVVLVQNVVGDTSEQIAGSSARKTAAQIAGSEIMLDAERALQNQPDQADTADEWASFYRGKCDRLKITYGDADIAVTAQFTYAGIWPTNVTAATAGVSAANTITAAANNAAAHCIVR